MCNLPRVTSQDDRSWFKDRRVILFGIGCALAGFLVGLLIFGKPFHLPPAWGDIPTWLLVLVAAIAGWIALSQLRQQQEVIEEDIKRRQGRDELLDGQLRELADREEARQREQAEQVNLVPWPVKLPKPTTGAEAEARKVHDEEQRRSGSCRVKNWSGRPIRRVACRLILDKRVIRAGKFGRGGTFSGSGPLADEVMFFPAEPGDVDSAAGEYLNLLAAGEISAQFTIPDDIDSYQEARYVIRFTDDAERRWELDGDMHLTPAPDQEW
jgi:hypothetical protein